MIMSNINMGYEPDMLWMVEICMKLSIPVIFVDYNTKDDTMIWATTFFSEI